MSVESDPLDLLDAIKTIMESLDNTDLHLDRGMQKITNIEPRLPFAPSFDMADRSMKWVPMTSSETESLWKCSICNVM